MGVSVHRCWRQLTIQCVTFLCCPSVIPKVPVLHDQTKHCQLMTRGFLMTLQHFLAGFAHLISSADHWLALSQGKGRTCENLVPYLHPASWEAITTCSVAKVPFPRDTCLSLWAGFKVLMEKYKKMAPNFHNSGASHFCQLMLFYLPSHSIYYFYQDNLGLVTLETSIPVVPVRKQNNFLTLE